MRRLSILRTGGVSRILLLSAIIGIAAIALPGTVSADSAPGTALGPNAPAGARYQLTLKPGQSSASMIIPDGDGGSLRLEAHATSTSSPLPSVTPDAMYGPRQCWESLGSLAPYIPGSWQVTLHSTFSWDYTSVYQQAPSLTTDYAIFPASISDKAASNSYWTQTVRFANGTFNQDWNLPYPGAVTNGHHLWIQEDAWGNCTYFSS